MIKASEKLITNARSIPPLDLGYPAREAEGNALGTYTRHLVALYKAQEAYRRNFISMVKRRFGIAVDSGED